AREVFVVVMAAPGVQAAFLRGYEDELGGFDPPPLAKLGRRTARCAGRSCRESGAGPRLYRRLRVELQGVGGELLSGRSREEAPAGAHRRGLLDRRGERLILLAP